MDAFLRILGIAVIAGSSASCGRLEREESGRVKVARGTIARKATAVGRIEVEHEVQVNSPWGGTLTKLFVTLGQRVERGDKLAEIRPILTDQTKLGTERALEQAALGEESAREYLEGKHLASFFTRMMLGEKNIERMHRQSVLGREQVEEQAELMEKGATKVGEYTIDYIVRAPAAGHVIEIRNREGAPIIPSSTYGTGSVFITLADMDRLLFRGTVDEIDVGKLAEGMAARIKIGALPSAAVTGKVAEIGLRAGERNNAVVFDVRIALDAAPDVKLRSGYSAVAEIEIERREDVLVLPERVVEFRGGKAFVQVPDGRGGREEKDIEAGLSDGLSVEVRGLAEGDQVLERIYE